jgi:acyl-CoA thioester hydrolase
LEDPQRRSNTVSVPDTRQLHAADLAPLPITCVQTISESYLDIMGHMNVMWYTHLFSRATIGLLARSGLSFAYFEAHHAGIFALETHLRYFVEVKMGNTIRIHSRAVNRSEKCLHFMHFLVIDQDDVLATVGEFISGHIDMNERHMTPIPAEIAAKFDTLCAEHSRLPWPAPVCGVMHADRGKS